MIKKIISMLLVLSMLLTVSAISFSAETIPENSGVESAKFADVTLYEDENTTICAQVPLEYVNEYTEKLKNEDFLQQELSNVLCQPTSLPEGRIISQRYMYKSDIRKKVDSLTAAGTFDSIMDKYGYAMSAVEMLIALSKVGRAVDLAASILIASVDFILKRSENWWKESMLMVISGEISCVRATHIENLKPTYPAAYYILERL